MKDVYSVRLRIKDRYSRGAVTGFLTAVYIDLFATSERYTWFLWVGVTALFYLYWIDYQYFKKLKADEDRASHLADGVE